MPSTKAPPAPPAATPPLPTDATAAQLYELLSQLSGQLTGTVGAFIALYTPDTIVWLDGPPSWAALRAPDEGMAQPAPEGATAAQLALTVRACRSLARLHLSLGSHYSGLAHELLEHGDLTATQEPSH